MHFSWHSLPLLIIEILANKKPLPLRRKAWSFFRGYVIRYLFYLPNHHLMTKTLSKQPNGFGKTAYSNRRHFAFCLIFFRLFYYKYAN